MENVGVRNDLQIGFRSRAVLKTGPESSLTLSQIKNPDALVDDLVARMQKPLHTTYLYCFGRSHLAFVGA